MGRPGYPAEFRRKVLDLLAEGRSVASGAPRTISKPTAPRGAVRSDVLRHRWFSARAAPEGAFAGASEASATFLETVKVPTVS